jgi:hypothetical protein
MAAAGVEAGTQHFDGDPSLNRLDGTAKGWTILGGARIGPWVVRGEGSRQGLIHDVQAATVIVDGRPLTIHSELTHRMEAVAALGGYAYKASPHLEIAALAGVAVVTVHRSFASDAGQLILVSPSTIPAAPAIVTLVDRFAAWSAGADVSLRASRHIGLVGGIRTEPLKLRSDLSGRSLRVLAGLAWRSR